MLTKIDMFFHFLKWSDLKKGILYSIRKAWKDAEIINQHHKDLKTKINNFDEKDLYLL